MIAVFVQKTGHAFYKSIDDENPIWKIPRTIPGALSIDDEKGLTQPSFYTDTYYKVCNKPLVYVER